MTICIVALCEKNKTAILVADRMITAVDTEFEQDTTKIEKLCGNCAAVTAGSALAHTEICRNVVNEFSDQPAPLIESVAERVKHHFVQLRLKRAEEETFKPMGLTVGGFLKSQKTLEDTVVMRLTRSLEEARLKLRILIAGVDKTGAHIYYIRDPGTSEIFDSIGYCAIGSGDRHAGGVMIDNDYTGGWPLRRAIYVVYEAKRRAEKAPGVGQKYTDIVIISQKKWSALGEKELEQLKDVFKRKSELEADLQKSLRPLIDKLPVY